MKKAIIIVLILAVFCFLIWFFFFKNKKDNRITLFGNIEIRQTDLSFRVSGRLNKLYKEEGDYVNGSEVLNFENKYIEEKDKFICYGVITENCYLENANSFIIEKKIKNILTKEQYENNCYRIEE